MIKTFFQQLGLDWHIFRSGYQSNTSEESRYHSTN